MEVALLVEFHQSIFGRVFYSNSGKAFWFLDEYMVWRDVVLPSLFLFSIAKFILVQYSCVVFGMLWKEEVFPRVFQASQGVDTVEPCC